MLRWAGLLGLLVFALFPCYWMVVSSLRPQAELFTVPPRLLPGTLTTEWYAVVLRTTRMPRYFLNSAVISTASMIVSLTIATLGAYGLTRFRYAGQRVLLLSVLTSYVLPPVLLLLPLYLTLGMLGLINSYAGVIVAHVTFTAPFCLFDCHQKKWIHPPHSASTAQPYRPCTASAARLSHKQQVEDLPCCSFQTFNLRQKNCRTTMRNCAHST